MFSDFYKDKKVFITGHTGFKGSWLAMWLLQLGAKVKGYSLAPYTSKDFYKVCGLDNKVNSVIADVRDYNKLQAEVNSFDPEVIFHLAAQPLVRESYSFPRETYEINVMGTVNLLEASKSLSNLKSVVVVTSDKCYENIETEKGYKETDPMGGHDPYSSSKGCTELVVSAYRNSFYQKLNIMLASARAGNVIGGGDWCKDRIIPDTINALVSGNPIQVRNPKAVRPWQHVLEPLSGYLTLGAKGGKNWAKYANAWNFGPESLKLIKVKEVVELVLEYWGSGSWEDVSDPKAVHEAHLLNLDCTKAKNGLDWEPVLSTEESIQLTVDWYRIFQNAKEDMYNFSLSQLNNYIEKARIKGIIWSK